MLQNDSVQIYLILFGFIILGLTYVVYRNKIKNKLSNKTNLTLKKTQTEFNKNISTEEARTKAQDLPKKPDIVESQVVKQITVSEALTQTKKNFFGRLQEIFSKDKRDYLEEIEEVLYTSDLGPQTVQKLLTRVTEGLNASQKADAELVGQLLNLEMKNIFSQLKLPENSIFQNQLKRLTTAQSGPSIWLIVGVNGAGKTTTIGKLSALAAEQNKKVIVAAGDTFRAAAQNQLKVWTERAQVEIFDPPQTSDPSAVAFDAVQKAKAQNYDVVIIDTAGRLHTQAHLMEELKKVKRVIQKIMPEAPHEVLLVLDGNSGQNALIQAKEFNQAVGVTGVTLTKMDGTAKGGVAVGIAHELKIPIKLIGIGEKIGDLREFEPNEFVDSII